MKGKSWDSNELYYKGKIVERDKNATGEVWYIDENNKIIGKRKIVKYKIK